MTRTILIVDDQPTEALPLVHYLEQQGYAIQFVESGGAALRLVAAERPDFIICDLEMPDIGGYQVLEVIGLNPSTHNLPFILAHVEWRKGNWSCQAGGRTADCHAGKPYVVREIAAFVKRIFQSIDEEEAGMLQART